MTSISAGGCGWPDTSARRGPGAIVVSSPRRHARRTGRPEAVSDGAERVLVDPRTTTTARCGACSAPRCCSLRAAARRHAARARARRRWRSRRSPALRWPVHGPEVGEAECHAVEARSRRVGVDLDTACLVRGGRQRDRGHWARSAMARRVIQERRTTPDTDIIPRFGRALESLPAARRTGNAGRPGRRTEI